jgi:acyl-CoA thioesterase-1
MRWLLLLLCILPLRAETVAFLGDSLTAGYGLEESQAYPALIQAALRTQAPQWTVVNAGVSGDTTAGGLRRLPWLLKRRPDLVVVALGGNDGLRGVPPAETEANLRRIVQTVRAAGARCAIMGMQMPQNYGEDHRRAFAAVFPAVAASEQVPLLPFLLEGVAMDPALNQADRIHPTAEGQRRVAAHVLPFLLPLVGVGTAGSATRAGTAAGATP